MPPTPSTRGRRTSSRAAAHAETPGHLRGKRLLVPASVFPKEKVLAQFAGWEARVVGADSNGREVLVKFKDYKELYHFPISEVETWVVEGEAGEPTTSEEEEEEHEGRAARRRSSGRRGSPRKAPAASGGPASRRRSVSSARKKQAEKEEAEEETEEEAEEEATAAAEPAGRRRRSAAAAAAAGEGGPRSSVRATPSRPAGELASPHSERTAAYSLRKRRAEEGAAPSVGGGQRQRRRGEGSGQQQRRQEEEVQEEEGMEAEGEEEELAEERAGGEHGWLGKTAETLRQGVLTTAAIGVTYGLLSTMFPLDTLG